MQLNVLNDLAKAKRRWTEKKSLLGPSLRAKSAATEEKKAIVSTSYQLHWVIELKHTTE